MSLTFNFKQTDTLALGEVIENVDDLKLEYVKLSDIKVTGIICSENED